MVDVRTAPDGQVAAQADMPDTAIRLAGHAVHDIELTAEEYVPAAQLLQIALLKSMNFPAAQVVHLAAS